MIAVRSARHVGTTETDDDGARGTAATETLTRDRAVEPDVADGEGEYAAGDRIDRYEIVGRLGSGGMGVVYAARDPELDREVAIKVVRPDRAGSSSASNDRARLLREARTLAKVTHPNVIAVYDAGTVDDAVFVAMELVRGETLGAWVAAKPRGWRAILRVAIDAATGIAAAHAGGLVHRDVKPSNILIGDDGRVRVLDFGLARAITDVAATAPVEAPPDAVGVGTPLTETGALIGTPAYMAPELIAGGAADERSDQFGFFVTLYEALFGERPFPGRTHRQLAAAMERGERRPMPREPSLPRRVRAAIERGLAADPAARFASMDEAIATLRRASRGRRAGIALGLGAGVAAAAIAGAVALAGGDPRDACAGAGDLAGAWDAPRRAAAAQAFAAVDASGGFDAVAAAVDAYAAELSAAARDACTRAENELDTPRVAGARARCLDERRVALDTFAASLAAVDSRSRADRAVVAATELDAHAPVVECSDPAVLAARALPEDPALRDAVTELERDLARVRGLRTGGDYREGLALAREVARRAEPLGYAPLSARAGYELGALMQNLGEDGADEVLREAARTAAVARDDLTAAFAWQRVFRHLTDTLENEGRLDELEELIPIVESAVVRAGDDGLRALWLRTLGLYHAARNEHAQARDAYAEALKHAETAIGPDSVEAGEAAAAVGDALISLGRDRDSLEPLRRALRLHERHYGPDHPVTGGVVARLGKAHEFLEEYDEALAYHRRAARLSERAYGTDSAEYAADAMGLARTESALGEHGDAVAHARAAVAARVAAHGAGHVEVGIAHVSLAGVLAAAGHRDEARRAYARAVAIYRETYGVDHPQYAVAIISAAEMDVEDGEYAAAVPRMREAVEIFAASLGDEHPFTLQAAYALGFALLESGDAAAARPLLERAHMCGEQCPPAARSAIAFGLARALWDTRGDRARAVELAESALALAEQSPDRTAEDVAAIRAWLAERRRP